jgi:hypothetical protein
MLDVITVTTLVVGIILMVAIVVHIARDDFNMW